MEEQQEAEKIEWKHLKRVIPFAVLLLLAMIYCLSFFYANLNESQQRKRSGSAYQPVLEIDPVTHKYVSK
jgi:hypothetical protein